MSVYGTRGMFTECAGKLCCSNFSFTYSFQMQIVLKEESGLKCDVFSFGMFLWEIVHRKIPFEGDNQILLPGRIAGGEVSCFQC